MAAPILHSIIQGRAFEPIWFGVIVTLRIWPELALWLSNKMITR